MTETRVLATRKIVAIVCINIFFCLVVQGMSPSLPQNSGCKNPSGTRLVGLNYATTHVPVIIDGDTELSLFPGIYGNGTPEHPYTISDLEIIGNYDSDCMILHNISKYLLITNCVLTKSSYMKSGIVISNCSNIRIKNNTIMDNGYGIYISNNSRSIECEDNTIIFNTRYGCFLSSTKHVIIKNNTISFNSFAGLSALMVSNVTIMENKISYNTINGFESWFASNVTISHNDFFLNANGLKLFTSQKVLIDNNRISNNSGYGLFLSESDSNLINNNTITRNNETGCYIFGSDLNNITSNTFYKNLKGDISLYKSFSNKMADNVFISDFDFVKVFTNFMIVVSVILVLVFLLFLKKNHERKKWKKIENRGNDKTQD